MKPTPKKKNMMTSSDDPLLATPITEAQVDTDDETVDDPTVPGVVPQPSGELATRVDVSSVAFDSLVVITMHETISPPPRVGTYDVAMRLGLTELTARKTYRLPKHVAEVLVDANKAEFIQLD